MAYVLASFPILEALEAAGRPLDAGAQEWRTKWQNLDLEAAGQYRFPELGGSTSITMKVELAATGKSRGSFQPPNSAGNPNTEIACFNLASILGWGQLVRPAARYELGPTAMAAFKSLILSTPINGALRRGNKTKILAAIAAGPPLLGAVKAKKPDSARALDAMADSAAGPNGGPRTGHAVIKALQATNPLPSPGTLLALANGYSGDARELAREYSVLMTLDAVFEQWDRYSGGNVGIRLDAGEAHFFATDNGGAGLSPSGTWVDRNLKWFSRYDRPVLDELATIARFLNGSTASYLGYASPQDFVRDLGLYFGATPQNFVSRLARNIAKLSARVSAQATAHGNAVYFP